ncbi:TIGR02530 family flagellar biosynthesis protein [Proteiniborus sp. MB09-C3]|uniref:TIGR02530 family flagellar biosynthesis protein n=1 Tax=Proteiniborus sp. MB09-C3 TaxID=3050072 RepID=UPI002553FA8D|nr:TIGR02530 family flagellar biosynthesis protein [Proteiniborus sp. MB09-C3]WIV13947.1 TIGR02530 family flagellar biosynthesis protein [Proteiniborus sp. MB09-C3]
MDIQNISFKILNNNKLGQAQQIRRDVPKSSFDELLKIEEQKQSIKFSKHAVERMQVRDISLDNMEMTRIEEAIDKASKKGVKEALILMDDKAFIASIKNKTIVTSVNKEQLKNNIFTNIDGAIII